MFLFLSYRKFIKIRLLVFVYLGLFLVGCAKDEPKEVPVLTVERHLVPYHTVTPSTTPDFDSGTKIVTPTPTVLHLPTSTPLEYTVVENDTLTSIAFKHSVDLDDLIRANPQIDPNFLTIGVTLTIPSEEIVATVLPTSNPIDIAVQPPECYHLKDGSLQCMSVVENDQPFAIENVIVLISLQTPAGDDPVTQIAISPHNIIHAGQWAAVAATFPPPNPSEYVANSSLLSGIAVMEDDKRYLQSELNVDEVTISSDEQRATIKGTIGVIADHSGSEQTIASTIWVTAFAYDAENKITGIRKWTADDPLVSGEKVNFNFIVYSLGLAIDHVDIHSETRP